MPLLREPQCFLAVARDDHLVAGAREAQLDEREDVLVVVRHEQHGDAVRDRVGEEQGVQHHLHYRPKASGIQVVAPPPNEGCSALEAVHRARRRQWPRVSLDVVVLARGVLALFELRIVRCPLVVAHVLLDVFAARRLPSASRRPACASRPSRTTPPPPPLPRRRRARRPRRADAAGSAPKRRPPQRRAARTTPRGTHRGLPAACPPSPWRTAPLPGTP